MSSTYGAIYKQPNHTAEKNPGKYVGILLFCVCVLTIGISMISLEDASTIMGLSTKPTSTSPMIEDTIYTDYVEDTPFAEFNAQRNIYLGKKGVNACPQNTEPIYNSNKCREQATLLGFSYYEKPSKESEQTVCNYCSGCVRRNPPNTPFDGGATARIDVSHLGRAYWICMDSKPPSATPTTEPTAKPTTKPTAEPTAKPTTKPTAEPTVAKPSCIEYGHDGAWTDAKYLSYATSANIYEWFSIAAGATVVHYSPTDPQNGSYQPNKAREANQSPCPKRLTDNSRSFCGNSIDHDTPETRQGNPNANANDFDPQQCCACNGGNNGDNNG